MNYMLLYFGAFAWMLTGGLFVYIAQLRKANERLEEKVYRLEGRIGTLTEDLECTEDALEYETHIATEMQEERDNAHKMLEFILSDENLKELSK